MERLEEDDSLDLKLKAGLSLFFCGESETCDREEVAGTNAKPAAVWAKRQRTVADFRAAFMVSNNY